ncbi:MAG: choice-of-anchor E domain-containing protein [Isosphaeraceae bacterium]|nr:choice-of-anchor E domain-containing protein [Isosphaeraceae bacterium]
MLGQRKPRCVAGLVFGLLLTASQSKADVTSPATIHFTIPGGAFATLSPPNGDYTSSPPNLIASGTTFPTILDVPQFDPAQGTLVGVSLQLSATQTGGNADFYAVLGPPTTTSILFDRAVVLSGASNVSLSADYSSGASSIPVGTVFSHDLSAPLVTTNQTVTDSANLAAFVGHGAVELNAIRSLNVYPSPSSEVFAKLTSTGSAAGQLTVTYDFTPSAVPEPSSLCLLGLTLAVTSTAAYLKSRTV